MWAGKQPHRNADHDWSDMHPHLINCKSSSGAQDTRGSTVTGSSIWDASSSVHPYSVGEGTVGSEIRANVHMVAWKCARRTCNSKETGLRDKIVLPILNIKTWNLT